MSASAKDKLAAKKAAVKAAQSGAATPAAAKEKPAPAPITAAAEAANKDAANKDRLQTLITNARKENEAVQAQAGKISEMKDEGAAAAPAEPAKATEETEETTEPAAPVKADEAAPAEPATPAEPAPAPTKAATKPAPAAANVAVGMEAAEPAKEDHLGAFFQSLLEKKPSQKSKAPAAAQPKEPAAEDVVSLLKRGIAEYGDKTITITPEKLGTNDAINKISAKKYFNTALKNGNMTDASGWVQLFDEMKNVQGIHNLYNLVAPKKGPIKKAFAQHVISQHEALMRKTDLNGNQIPEDNTSGETCYEYQVRRIPSEPEYKFDIYFGVDILAPKYLQTKELNKFAEYTRRSSDFLRKVKELSKGAQRKEEIEKIIEALETDLSHASNFDAALDYLVYSISNPRNMAGSYLKRENLPSALPTDKELSVSQQCDASLHNTVKMATKAYNYLSTASNTTDAFHALALIDQFDTRLEINAAQYEISCQRLELLGKEIEGMAEAVNEAKVEQSEEKAAKVAELIQEMKAAPAEAPAPAEPEAPKATFFENLKAANHILTNYIPNILEHKNELLAEHEEQVKVIKDARAEVNQIYNDLDAMQSTWAPKNKNAAHSPKKFTRADDAKREAAEKEMAKLAVKLEVAKATLAQEEMKLVGINANIDTAFATLDAANEELVGKDFTHFQEDKGEDPQAGSLGSELNAATGSYAKHKEAVVNAANNVRIARIQELEAAKAKAEADYTAARESILKEYLAQRAELAAKQAAKDAASIAKLAADNSDFADSFEASDAVLEVNRMDLTVQFNAILNSIKSTKDQRIAELTDAIAAEKAGLSSKDVKTDGEHISLEAATAALEKAVTEFNKDRDNLFPNRAGVSTEVTAGDPLTAAEVMNGRALNTELLKAIETFDKGSLNNKSANEFKAQHLSEAIVLAEKLVDKGDVVDPFVFATTNELHVVTVEDVYADKNARAEKSAYINAKKQEGAAKTVARAAAQEEDDNVLDLSMFDPDKTAPDAETVVGRFNSGLQERLEKARLEEELAKERRTPVDPASDAESENSEDEAMAYPRGAALGTPDEDTDGKGTTLKRFESDLDVVEEEKVRDEPVPMTTAPAVAAAAAASDVKTNPTDATASAKAADAPAEAPTVEEPAESDGGETIVGEEEEVDGNNSGDEEVVTDPEEEGTKTPTPPEKEDIPVKMTAAAAKPADAPAVVAKEEPAAVAVPAPAPAASAPSVAVPAVADTMNAVIPQLMNAIQQVKDAHMQEKSKASIMVLKIIEDKTVAPHLTYIKVGECYSILDAIVDAGDSQLVSKVKKHFTPEQQQTAAITAAFLDNNTFASIATALGRELFKKEKVYRFVSKTKLEKAGIFKEKSGTMPKFKQVIAEKCDFFAKDIAVVYQDPDAQAATNGHPLAESTYFDALSEFPAADGATGHDDVNLLHVKDPFDGNIDN